MTEIVAERLAQLPALSLDRGSHASFDDGHCAMELVSYLADEPFSDAPRCACPVLTAFVVAWNDALPDEDRTRILQPFLPRLIGTRSTKDIENRRATMAADWFVRVHTPAWLRLAGLTTHADALAAFPEITDFAKTPSLMPALEAARKDAAAAWDAARDAARAAARDAAWDAAWAAAWDAARAAAWDAARDAAWAALKPIVVELQASASDLLDRMINVGAAQ